MQIPELVVPAGNFSKLQTAIEYGADTVYVGAAGYSMRPDEASFSVEALDQAIDYAHTRDKKLLVAVNSLMFDDDLDSLKEWLTETSNLAFDALIVSDAGAFDLVRQIRPDQRIHISTQMSTSNAASATFWKNAGAERIVLARECSLQQASQIARDSGVEVEIFVHGAMCVAVSGRCLLSAHLCGHSGSRGQCKHSCRWEWQLVESKRPGMALSVFETDRETILMGSTDLCMIEHIPELAGSGVHALKIEGRMKSEYYIATVTRTYRAALDAFAASPERFEFDPTWLRELEAVSHRPHATGFAFGYPSSKPDILQTNNWPVSTHDMVGVLEDREGEHHVIMVKNHFSIGDVLEWIGPGMSGAEVTVASITGPKDNAQEAAHCGTTLKVAFADGATLPKCAILRRERQNVRKA